MSRRRRQQPQEIFSVFIAHIEPGRVARLLQRTSRIALRCWTTFDGRARTLQALSRHGGHVVATRCGDADGRPWPVVGSVDEPEPAGLKQPERVVGHHCEMPGRANALLHVDAVERDVIARRQRIPGHLHFAAPTTRGSGYARQLARRSGATMTKAMEQPLETVHNSKPSRACSALLATDRPSCRMRAGAGALDEHDFRRSMFGASLHLDEMAA